MGLNLIPTYKQDKPLSISLKSDVDIMHTVGFHTFEEIIGQDRLTWLNNHIEYHCAVFEPIIF